MADLFFAFCIAFIYPGSISNTKIRFRFNPADGSLDKDVDNKIT